MCYERKRDGKTIDLPLGRKKNNGGFTIWKDGKDGETLEEEKLLPVLKDEGKGNRWEEEKDEKKKKKGDEREGREKRVVCRVH